MVDTIQTTIFPFVLLLILNSLTCLKLVRNSRKTKFCLKVSEAPKQSAPFHSLRHQTSFYSIEMPAFSVENRKPSVDDLLFDPPENVEKKSEPINTRIDIITNLNKIEIVSKKLSACNMKIHQMKLSGSNKQTKVLLLIVSVFFLLNLPIAISKLVFFVEKNSLLPDFNDTMDSIKLQANQSTSNSSLLKNESLPLSHVNFEEEQIVSFQPSNNSLEQESNKVSSDDLSNEILAIQLKELFLKLSNFLFYLNFSLNFFFYIPTMKNGTKKVVKILNR
jgi:hypothetical protein